LTTIRGVVLQRLDLQQNHKYEQAIDPDLVEINEEEWYTLSNNFRHDLLPIGRVQLRKTTNGIEAIGELYSPIPKEHRYLAGGFIVPYVADDGLPQAEATASRQARDVQLLEVATCTANADAAQPELELGGDDD
jgi:hypothetical protein